MPAFEGLGLGAEKAAVIFDFGRAYSKCGFAGECGPRCIIPSEVKKPNCSKPLKLYSTNLNDDELYNILVDFIHLMFFRKLLVSPKERRVVVVESVLSTTTRFRNILAKVLFLYFEVPSLFFASSHTVSLFTLGIPSALVLDCGYSETVVLPVYEGVPLLKAWQALPLGSQAIHQYLEAQMKEVGTIKVDQNVEVPLTSVLESVDESVLEDVKVRTCFVTKIERAKAMHAVTGSTPTLPPNVEYPLDGNKILLITGKMRETACEVLFERDAEESSIATLILDALIKCPVDTRRPLAENIVIIGGTSMLPGFKHRLMTELHDIVAMPKYQSQLAINTFKFHTAPAKENCVAWLGGSLFGALDILATRSMGRDQYLKGVPLPDWCSLNNTDDGEDGRNVAAVK
jgi:actin-related protein 10